MATWETFRRQALASSKANLQRANRLVQLHQDMLKSDELSASQREILKLDLKKHQRVAKDYESLIRRLEGHR